MTAGQQYLFQNVAVALEHASKRYPLTHADHLRVLEAFREAFTEDWITTQPEVIPHISKLLGKS